jgi:hypothetical protein
VPRTEGAFPTLSLPGIDAPERPLSDTWSRGPALVLIGHSDCTTTREALPFVDRIHRRCTQGSVTVILQDDGASARRLADSLGIEMPIRLEADPYPLATALEVTIVPTVFALTPKGEIVGVSEGFSRADLEAFAERLGVEGPLFGPEDTVAALKPG